MYPEKIVEYLNTKTTREAEQGVRFKYATIKTEISDRALTRATGLSISQLTEELLVSPWVLRLRWAGCELEPIRVKALAVVSMPLCAICAQPGILLANDGQRDGVLVTPLQFLLDATNPVRQPSAFRPRVATAGHGYGYQTWLMPFKEIGHSRAVGPTVSTFLFSPSWVS